MRQLSALFMVFVGYAGSMPVLATEIDVHASATFRQAPTLSVEQNMHFTPEGQAIEYQAEPTSADRVHLGTDGSLTSTGSAFIAPSTGQAGAVRVAGDGTSSIDIACTANAALATTSGETLTLTNLEFAIDTGTSAGNALPCQGLNTTTSTHTLDGDDQLLLGGALVGNSTLTDSTYSTTHSGGLPASFRVVYN